jgi:hypothetical protein
MTARGRRDGPAVGLGELQRRFDVLLRVPGARDVDSLQQPVGHCQRARSPAQGGDVRISDDRGLQWIVKHPLLADTLGRELRADLASHLLPHWPLRANSAERRNAKGAFLV